MKKQINKQTLDLENSVLWFHQNTESKQIQMTPSWLAYENNVIPASQVQIWVEKELQHHSSAALLVQHSNNFLSKKIISRKSL